MSDEELQGDDPTLIAIIAQAHGYYVDDFNDAPIEAVPIMVQPRVQLVSLPLPDGDVTVAAFISAAWLDATYGHTRAA